MFDSSYSSLFFSLRDRNMIVSLAYHAAHNYAEAHSLLTTVPNLVLKPASYNVNLTIAFCCDS